MWSEIPIYERANVFYMAELLALGGKDAAIVPKDGDLNFTAENIVSGTYSYAFMGSYLFHIGILDVLATIRSYLFINIII